MLRGWFFLPYLPAPLATSNIAEVVILGGSYLWTVINCVSIDPEYCKDTNCRRGVLSAMQGVPWFDFADEKMKQSNILPEGFQLESMTSGA